MIAVIGDTRLSASTSNHILTRVLAGAGIARSCCQIIQLEIEQPWANKSCTIPSDEAVEKTMEAVNRLPDGTILIPSEERPR